MKFEGFGKIPRLSRECIVTEKIDGSNAQICIVPLDAAQEKPSLIFQYRDLDISYAVYVGSRKRWINLEDDNFGFCKWVYENADCLIPTLGVGKHFGEWWGSGINRAYGLQGGERKFSLFNTSRWNSDNKPACCEVVPQLYVGEFTTSSIKQCLWELEVKGSVAAPGFMRPEGVIIYHTAGNLYFKKTIENDDKPKGSTE